MLDESSVDSIEISSDKGMKIRISKTPSQRGTMQVAGKVVVVTGGGNGIGKALCEAFHKPCIGHGSFGLPMAGRIQAHAAWGAPLEEMALATPPLLPQEQWAPALKILNQKELYTFRNGEIQVPQGPGLGLDLNEEAIEHYKA